MRLLHYKLSLLVFGMALMAPNAAGQPSPATQPRGRIASNILLEIIRHEDQRRWDDRLKVLLAHTDPAVRKRAALAAGRIGAEGAVPELAEMVLMDRNTDVRQMAAFALGEIESPGGAFALVEVLKDPNRPGRARALEALGKVTAAMMIQAPGPAGQAATTPPEDDRIDIFKAAILDALRVEDNRRPQPERLTILVGLTAVLRTRPEGTTAPALVKRFLSYSDPRIVADALNTFARLRWKQGNDEARKLLAQHRDPIVRANAARVLGTAEDKQSFDALLDRALNDSDLRVRVSAIRALGSLKDERAAQPLFDRAASLILALRNDRPALTALRRGVPPSDQNEWLEILTATGNVLAGKTLASPVKPPTDPPPPEFIAWQKKHAIREFEVAVARSEPGEFVKETEAYFFKSRDKGAAESFFADWRRVSSIAQGLGVIATTPLRPKDGEPKSQAQKLLLEMINDRRVPALALPDLLTAYAAFKPEGLADLLRHSLQNRDVIVRSTASELLGNQPPADTSTRALVDALNAELPRTEKGEMNDAALAILDALGKQKAKEANEAIKTALASSDHLIRRKAADLLKANGAGDFSSRIGTVQTRNTNADYRRAIARIGKRVTATVVTSKGSFAIEFLSEEAPLNVDNFIQLARRGYFNGQTIPRVVPNFVVQAGDPRGDQNGGPGYQIVCEINEVPYERAAVGMALSGKDTGGSQWFVTHSPQPHLDGGYTVFGRVVSGMEVVDRIARGDFIRRVIINGN